MFRGLLLTLLVAALSSVSAFAPPSHIHKSQAAAAASSRRHVELEAMKPSADNMDEQSSYSPIRMDQLSVQDTRRSKSLYTGITGMTTGLLTWSQNLKYALADYYTDGASDDLEIESLPPPYVPIIFAIVIIGGVGLLTSSLGDVMYDEASWGMQSGAQAKKERERSRASYFKKK